MHFFLLLPLDDALDGLVKKFSLASRHRMHERNLYTFGSNSLESKIQVCDQIKKVVVNKFLMHLTLFLLAVVT